MSLGDRGGGMSWKFTSFISPSEILSRTKPHFQKPHPLITHSLPRSPKSVTARSSCTDEKALYVTFPTRCRIQKLLFCEGIVKIPFTVCTECE